MAKQDFEYSRQFFVSSDLLINERIELVACGLDTLCMLILNGTVLGRTDNIYRTWRFDVKPFLCEGNNLLQIFIENPYPYFEKRQSEENLFSMANQAKGSQYLRKTPCHFGWDWGPILPPAGLIGSIELESYGIRIKDLHIVQRHEYNKVFLNITGKITDTSSSSLQAFICCIAPDGFSTEYPAVLIGNDIICTIEISSPELWWCNGLGAQPLYQLELQIRSIADGALIDSCSKKIGLRTIELDTSPDKWGNQFRFLVNGVPIFAKGADWIPSDSFITRTSRSDLEFYIESAHLANMNMLRIWGGGMYESDDFYDLCDQYGILLWQDFIFACGAYPLFDSEFLNNVHQEVLDNVTRLRHHASLALWCGNNENELMASFWKKNKLVADSNAKFYHNTLRSWVADIDGVTPYWPGSPSSGSLTLKPHNMKDGTTCGDTHLWQVWHGMLPIEAFRKFPTRFCSEFGMESMPSMSTIHTFTAEPNLSEFDPVMQAHQKSVGGNEKILFYLLAKYRNPAKFEDFVYLSQIVQADTIRFATDCWRRNLGRHNGAIFWQYNDCWPVASWASIDYGKQYKALQYKAKHFNKMLCLSNDYYKDRVELYLINEYPTVFAGELDWKLCTFDGKVVNQGSVLANVDSVSAGKIIVLHFSEVLKSVNKKDVFLQVVFRRGTNVLDHKMWLLVPDKDAHLPKSDIKLHCSVTNGIAEVTLTSALYARHVFISAEDVISPWSDNFFDLISGEPKTIQVPLPDGMDKEIFEKNLHLHTLADVDSKNSRFKDKLLRFSMIFKKSNFITWIIFKFI
ncbi:MAG: glycoside hydrolase family 2 protein [Mobilitalea sp.]